MNSGISSSFLDACEQCDERTVSDLIQKKITALELNARDKTGKSGLSHACSNGYLPILSQFQLPELDVNLPDKEGNTPLIFAAQAGHSDAVNLLLHKYPDIEVDKANHQGYTALMKAAIQGRSKCAKLLLCAGASPRKRDPGRSLCALEWAEYCGRHDCAQTIATFMQASFSLGLEGDFELLNRLRFRSDLNLSAENDTQNQISPSRFMNKVRRSLPTTSASAECVYPSPLQSLEDVTKLLYLPLFPEKVSSASMTPLFWKLKSQTSTKELVIPKVEVSKDDNWFYELSSVRKKGRSLSSKKKKIVKYRSI